MLLMIIQTFFYFLIRYNWFVLLQQLVEVFIYPRNNLRLQVLLLPQSQVRI